MMQKKKSDNPFSFISEMKGDGNSDHHFICVIKS